MGMKQHVFEWVKAILWTCPRCGEHYLTPELAPRCSRCFFKEGT